MLAIVIISIIQVLPVIIIIIIFFIQGKYDPSGLQILRIAFLFVDVVLGGKSAAEGSCIEVLCWP